MLTILPIAFVALSQGKILGPKPKVTRTQLAGMSYYRSMYMPILEKATNPTVRRGGGIYGATDETIYGTQTTIIKDQPSPSSPSYSEETTVETLIGDWKDLESVAWSLRDRRAVLVFKRGTLAVSTDHWIDYFYGGNEPRTEGSDQTYSARTDLIVRFRTEKEQKAWEKGFVEVVKILRPSLILPRLD